MSRLLPTGLAEALKRGTLETHSTLELTLPDDATGPRTLYFATAPVTVAGVKHSAQLRETGAIKQSLTRAADRVTVDLQNVDTVLGIELIGASEAFYGSRVRFGRYWRDVDSGATFHKYLLTGAVVGVDVNENVARLQLVSDAYAALNVGASQPVVRNCRAEVVGGFKGWLCGSTSDFLTCNYLLDHADGCSARHSGTNNRARFAGCAYIKSQATVAGAAAAPIPASNQLVKLVSTDLATVTTPAQQQPFFALNSETFTVSNDAPNEQTVITPKGIPTGFFHVVFGYDAPTDGTTDATTAIQAAIDAAEAAGGGTVFLPSGEFKTTGLTVSGHVKITGSSDGETLLYSTSNAPIIEFTAASFEMPIVENLRIQGSVSAGSGQIGIKVDDPTFGLRAVVRNVWIENCGGDGVYIGLAFSSIFENIYSSNCAGYPFHYNAPNMPGNVLISCYAGLLRDSAPVGFRVRAGEAVLKNCNGVNSVNANSKWAAVGKKSGLDGDVTNAGALLDLEDCNLETYVDSGIHAYSFSQVNLRGVTAFVGQLLTNQLNGGIDDTVTTITVDTTLSFSDAGTIEIDTERITYTGLTATTFTGCTRGAEGTSAASHSDNATVKFLKKPIVVEHINDGVDYFAQTLVRGVIEDSVKFSDGPLTNYVRNQAIHCNGFAPFQTTGRGARVTSGDPLGTYWDSTAGITARLARADSYLSKATVTATTTFPQPGVRYIEVNHSASTTITLPWPGWYAVSETITVKDVSSGGAATNNIILNATGGGTVNGGSYTLNQNGQAVILAADGSNDWRVIATYSPGLSASLTNTYVGVGNGSNVLSGSSQLRFDGTTFTVTKAGGNPYIEVNDTTNSITTRFGPLAGAPDRAIIGTTSNHPFVFYQNGTAGWGLDTSRNLVPFSGTYNLGTASVPINDAYLGGIISLEENTAPTTPPSNTIFIYSKDNGGVSALYYKDDGGTEYQLGASGANTALSNLASVAINTTLVSDTDNTDDLGSSAVNWRDGFFGRDLVVKRRIISGGSAGSTTTGTGAGTTPSLTIDGNDVAGAILLTTGTTPATASKILDVTLAASFANYPVVILTAGNAAAAIAIAEGRVFVDDAVMTASKFTLKSGAVALDASADYIFYFHCIGF